MRIWDGSWLLSMSLYLSSWSTENVCCSICTPQQLSGIPTSYRPEFVRWLMASTECRIDMFTKATTHQSTNNLKTDSEAVIKGCLTINNSTVERDHWIETIVIVWEMSRAVEHLHAMHEPHEPTIRLTPYQILNSDMMISAVLIRQSNQQLTPEPPIA